MKQAIIRQAIMASVMIMGASALDAAVVKEYERVNANEAALLPGEELAGDLFTDNDAWVPFHNFGGKLRVSFTNGVVNILGANVTNTVDTAWSLRTKKRPLKIKGLGYALSFGFESGINIEHPQGSGNYCPAVIWYDAFDKEIARDSFPLTGKAGKYRECVLIGSVPAAAETWQVNFGFDSPNLIREQYVKLDHFRLGIMEHETDPRWMPKQIPEAPRVRIVSTTPTEDKMTPVEISVAAAKPVDRATIVVKIDQAQTAFETASNEHEMTLRIVPTKNWASGLHRVDIQLVDPMTGEVQKYMKYFLIGKTTKTTVTSLRADGMTLVNGKPFFPIGIYGVMKRKENGMSLDRACADLKAGGFNTVHSYSDYRNPEFLDAAGKYGLLVFNRCYEPDKLFADNLRHRPEVLTWYIGDDTSMHVEPPVVFDRDDNVRACDPTRITCQADVMNSGDAVSSYFRFVKTTDVFMPEIYPIHNETPNPYPDCVAKTIRDMKRFKTDVAEAKDYKPHGIWPIIQYFKGWSSWKRFPTREELFAMTYASIIHGAHGVTFYTYGGLVEPEKKRFNYGVASSPEVWANMTNLATRLNAMIPVFLAPACPQPAPAKIISGPKADPLGNESVSMLLKRHGGEAYLLTVNGTDKEVVAEFDLGTEAASVEVMYENRRLSFKRGKLRDTFKPLEVHIYKMKTWNDLVTRVEIRSTKDSTMQPAWFWAPECAKTTPVPLFIGLHTWSANLNNLAHYWPAYEWCKAHDWALICPNFRGANSAPPACGSDLAVQDILDAVNWAKSTTKIDADRVYIMGGSGGGHMTLLMAGRAPEVFAGACAWCPISDLARWHDETEKMGPVIEYAIMLEKSCLGKPATRMGEYRLRSPLTHLANARSVAVSIGTGIHDGHRGCSVPVGHTIRAFNALCQAKDTISEDAISEIEKTEKIPASLKNESAADSFYDKHNRIHLRRTSGNVQLTLFEGGHSCNFPAGFEWLARQRRGTKADFSTPQSGRGKLDQLTR